MTIDNDLLALREQYRQKNNLDYDPAVVGDANGNPYDTDIPGNIIVRQKTSNGLSAPRSVLPPTNSGISLSAGMNVELEYNTKGKLYIAHIDTAQNAATTGNPLQAIQPIVPANTPQTKFGTLLVIPTQPTPNLSVTIKSWNPMVGATVYQFNGATVDLTSYLPSAGNMHYAMLAIENDYATVRIVTSTARSTSDLPLGLADLQECATALSATDTAVYALKLTGGQTKIAQSDIDNDGIDMRQLVNNAAGAALVLTPQANHAAFIGPASGGPLNPTWRLLVASDIPDLSGSYLPLTGGTLTGPVVFTPQGVPATAEGKVYYDSTAHALEYYNGSGWVSIGSGSVTSITAGAGLTGGTITTTGTIALSIPVSTANGGTGLTASGSSQNALFSNGSIWTSRVIDAGDVQTGTFANARVNWAAPGTLGSTTPSTIAGTNLTITGGGFVRPSADSTAAILFTKADGTTVIATIDSTNARFGLGTTPTSRLHVQGANSGVTLRVQNAATIPGNLIEALQNGGAGGGILFSVASTGYTNINGQGVSAGDQLFAVSISGSQVLAVKSANGTAANVGITSSTNAAIALSVTAASSSQTGNLQEWRNSTNSARSFIAADLSATLGAFDANTSSIISGVTVQHTLTTVNAGANGIGVDITFRVADSTSAIGAVDKISRIRNWWTNATNTANTLAMQGALSGYWNSAGTITERDVMQWGVSGTGAALWSVFSVTTPIAQPASTVTLGLALSNLGLRAAGAPALELLSKFNADTVVANTLASIVGSVSLTAQTATIAATNIFNPPSNGMYEASVYLEDTTASTSGGTVLASILYNDDNGPATQSTATIVLSITGFTSNVFTFFATTAAQIQFSTTVSGVIVGSPQYALRIIIKRLS